MPWTAFTTDAGSWATVTVTGASAAVVAVRLMVRPEMTSEIWLDGRDSEMPLVAPILMIASLPCCRRLKVASDACVPEAGGGEGCGAARRFRRHHQPGGTCVPPDHRRSNAGVGGVDLGRELRQG